MKNIWTLKMLPIFLFLVAIPVCLQGSEKNKSVSKDDAEKYNAFLQDILKDESIETYGYFAPLLLNSFRALVGLSSLGESKNNENNKINVSAACENFAQWLENQKTSDAETARIILKPTAQFQKILKDFSKDFSFENDTFSTNKTTSVKENKKYKQNQDNNKLLSTKENSNSNKNDQKLFQQILKEILKAIENNTTFVPGWCEPLRELAGINKTVSGEYLFENKSDRKKFEGACTKFADWLQNQDSFAAKAARIRLRKTCFFDRLNLSREVKKKSSEQVNHIEECRKPEDSSKKEYTEHMKKLKEKMKKRKEKEDEDFINEINLDYKQFINPKLKKAMQNLVHKACIQNEISDESDDESDDKHNSMQRSRDLWSIYFKFPEEEQFVDLAVKLIEMGANINIFPTGMGHGMIESGFEYHKNTTRALLSQDAKKTGNNVRTTLIIKKLLKLVKKNKSNENLNFIKKVVIPELVTQFNTHLSDEQRSKLKEKIESVSSSDQDKKELKKELYADNFPPQIDTTNFSGNKKILADAANYILKCAFLHKNTSIPGYLLKHKELLETVFTNIPWKSN